MTSPSPRHDTPLISAESSGASALGECGNCKAALAGPFCAQCGEKKFSSSDYSVVHLADEILGEFTHFDTKFLRTLKVLLTRPGELSRAYFHGGRSRYTKPLTLFIIINVIFFLVQPHTNLLHYKYADYLYDPHHRSAIHAHLLQTKEPEVRYAARFDANLQDQKKSLLIVSVPILALVMGVLFIGARRTYAEHLVFSVQVYAFMLTFLPAALFLVLIPVAIVAKAVGPAAALVANGADSDVGISILLLSTLTIYIYKGLRRAYDASRVRAAISAVVMAFTVGQLTGVYHNELFYATFWIT